MSFCRQNSFRLILLWYNSSIMANICACRASVFCIKYKLLAPKVDGCLAKIKMHQTGGIQTICKLSPTGEREYFSGSMQTIPQQLSYLIMNILFDFIWKSNLVQVHLALFHSITTSYQEGF